MTIYTLGYARWSVEDVSASVRSRGGVLIDVRMRPSTSKPGFKREELVHHLGKMYVHLPEFGNVNYRGGAVQLKDPGAGIERLKSMLAPGQPPILMCGCADHRRCHRSQVAERLKEAFGSAQVEHLYPAGREPTRDLFADV